MEGITVRIHHLRASAIGLLGLCLGALIALAALSSTARGDDAQWILVPGGVADASGTTDADIPILLADDLTEWLLPVVHSTAATAVTAITNIGAQYCLSHLNTGGWYGYEISQTSNPIIEISEIAKDYAVGEQYGWAWGKIINNARIIA